MLNKQIIGLLGSAGSGKDTVAAEFVKAGFEKESFANPLKDTVSAIFGYSRALLEGDTPEGRAFRDRTDPFWSKRLSKQVTPRYLLQYCGTEVLRNNLNRDIWLHSLEKRITASEKDNFIISDVRFRNEIMFLDDLGARFIIIQRGEPPEWMPIAKKANSGDRNAKRVMQDKYSEVHESEWDWVGSHADYTLDNNGSIEDLQAKVYGIIEEITND